MRKLGIGLLALAFTLTACSGAVDAAPTESVDPEQAFITEFRAENPDADRATDEQWLEVAHAVCAALDEGATPNQVVDQFEGSNMDSEESASLVIIATMTICSEFSPLP